jgi:uncharacterized surface anchored protein
VLEQGYYLLEQTAPAGYILSTEKTSIAVKEGETTEIIVINKAVEKPTNPDPEPKPGKLLIIKKAEKSGTLLKGAVFGVYRESDGKLIKEITTDRYGEATLELALGDYYLRELEAPAGFRLDSGRLAFRIKFGETKEITIVNKAKAATTGTLLLIKKSENGKALSGAVFEVFSLSDNKKVGGITSGSDGTAALSLTPGEYYLLEKTPPIGYKLETARILFRVKAGDTVKVEVTNVKDDGGQPVQPTKPNPPTGGSTNITIPKTGEVFPTQNYVLAGLMFAFAGVCGFALWWERRKERRMA